LDLTVLLIFLTVYLGMILGGLPGLNLDRTGAALLGAIALLVFGKLSFSEAWLAIDSSTLALLFGLMVISAQFRLSGFYTFLIRKTAASCESPRVLLAYLVAVVGFLSSLLANDIVCLAVAPILIEICEKRAYDPVPFLLALACAANVGSAATLIGNPQNMLIGQKLGLHFGHYLLQGAVPSLLGLFVVWGVICGFYCGHWQREIEITEAQAPPFDAWETIKGFLVMLLLVAFFLAAEYPRAIIALAAAGVLLCSRRMHSREILGLIDWQLLVLFIALFVVIHSIERYGIFEYLMQFSGKSGLDLRHPAWLFTLSAALSNVVSNVPAVMLLLPSATYPVAGPVLALSSTFAGNLIVVGSIANIIVIEQAASRGIRITWREHAKVGVPVTLLTLALAAVWLWLVPL